MWEKSVQVTVSRFDPSVDREPYLQTYEVPFVEGMTVLEALDYIYEHLDGSLAYYAHAACRQGICGRCTALVNGKPSLICQTPVKGDIVVEPLARAEVVRDLVCQRGRRPER
ncbi:MAG: 2Fe-2S iron-sulfur cluster-binding protein [Anaerolineae bacterium]